MSSVLFSVWFTIKGIIQSTTCSVRFRIQCIIKKMSRVLFSVWFTIQDIIQNTTCSVWFRIQRIIKKCPGYYSASGSVFRALFKIRPAASASGFSVLLKNIQGIIQRLVQFLGIIQNTTCSVWFKIQRIIQKCPGYYSVVWFIIQDIIQNTTCSVWFSVQRIIKNVQGTIHLLVQYSEFYSKYDLQRVVQDSAYY